jgi:hypothetical protein
VDVTGTPERRSVMPIIEIYRARIDEANVDRLPFASASVPAAPPTV